MVALAVNLRLVFCKYILGIAVVILRRSHHDLFLPSISRFTYHPTVMHVPVHLPSFRHARTGSPIIPPSRTYRFTNHPTVMHLPVHQSSHRHALTSSPIILPLWTSRFTSHPTFMHYTFRKNERIFKLTSKT